MEKRKEIIYATFIALIILIIVNAPIVYFSIFGKDGMTFLGRTVINSQDVYTYVAQIEQAKRGKILFQNVFTNEAQQATMFRPSYLLIGKVANAFNLSSIVAYHLARVLLAIVFCLVLYLFLHEVFTRPKQRLLAFVIVLTSSGLGWLLKGIVSGTADLWIPEANTFLSLAESPHFILAQTLILVTAILFLRYIRYGERLLGICFCATLFFLGLEHPFDLLILVPTLVLTAVSSGISLMEILPIIGLGCLGAIYPWYELHANPIFALEQSQGASYSPSPINFLVGFGLLGPLAVIGTEKFLSKKRDISRLILFWCGIGLVMLYAPVPFQRRLSEGIHLPISILATVGILTIMPWIRGHLRMLLYPLLAGLILILSLSSLYVKWTDYTTIRTDTKDGYYYFLLNPEVEGIKWLESNAGPDDVILSNWFYGNLIAGMTGRTVYVGHKAQTIDYDTKVGNINRFLEGKNIGTDIIFLKTNRIRYIFLGENDSMTTYGFEPDKRPYLHKVWEKGGASIYKFAN